MLYNGFNIWLKEYVASNVHLYTIWFYSIRKYRGDNVRLPADGDDLYFDAYPRSGNTFFTGLLKRVYPNKYFADHLHVISGLKIAIKLDLPIFVIIREPKDAVISNLYRKIIMDNAHASPNQELIEELLISYYNYYSFVKKNIRGLHIMNFESCIKDEVLVIKKIAELAKIEAKPEVYLQEILERYRALMKRKETEKDSHASSLPNNQRQAFKKENLNKVLNSDFYEMAQTVYDELTRFDLLTKEKEINS